jgi:hypothetical protein
MLWVIGYAGYDVTLLSVMVCVTGYAEYDVTLLSLSV